MKLLKKYLFVFAIALVAVSCSSDRRELNNILQKHKGKTGIGDIKELVQDRKLDEALYKAASFGYSDVVAQIVKAGADINIKGLDGATPLILFCRDGNIDAAKILIENGADVSIKDNNNLNILDSLSYYGDKRELVSYMYEKNNVIGADSLLNITNSDLSFISEFSYGPYMNYYTYNSKKFYVNNNIYVRLSIEALGSDLYVRSNTIAVKLCFPKVNYNEYAMELSKGKLIRSYKDKENVVYELGVELYEDINAQEMTINNEFVFVIRGNDGIQVPIKLEFPYPYESNNKKDTIEFVNY